MYIASVGKPTFMMILNRMMDILWQTASAVTNGTTTNSWTLKLKFFEIKSTTYNGNALLQKKKLYENEIKGLTWSYVEKYDILKNFLVFRGKFGQINIWDSLVPNGRYPQNLIVVV